VTGQQRDEDNILRTLDAGLILGLPNQARAYLGVLWVQTPKESVIVISVYKFNEIPTSKPPSFLSWVYVCELRVPRILAYYD